MVDEVAEGHILDGKYRIEKVIGRGGMGVVVSARHLALDEVVAIKFLTEQALINEEAVARFAREARASVKIKSEHVVRVLDVGRLSSGAPYMVMEFLTGEDLAKRLEARGTLPVDQAVDFVLQACMALAGAHGAGIVHRDIKPANLFCVPGSDGHLTIKVLDFGISKLNPLVGEGSMSVTKTASVMGSPLYMSPEQVQSAKDVDARTDVWALGIVLFELIAGRVPFFGEAFGEVAIKIATAPLPSLTEYRRDVPPGLDDVLRTCLAKDRNGRFASVAELAVALRRFASPRGQAFVERIGRIAMSASGRSFDGSPSQPAPSSAVAVHSAPTQHHPETLSVWAETGSRRSNKRAVVWTVVATVLVLGGGAAAFIGSHSSAPGVASAPALVTSPTAVPPSPAANPSPAATAPQVEVLPTPQSATPAPTLDASAVPTPTPSETSTPARRGTPAKRAPRSAPTPVTTSEPRPSVPVEPPPPPRPAAPPAATARPAPKPDCDPPFTLDEQGRKKFKPECFLK